MKNAIGIVIAIENVPRAKLPPRVLGEPDFHVPHGHAYTRPGGKVTPSHARSGSGPR